MAGCGSGTHGRTQATTRLLHWPHPGPHAPAHAGRCSLQQSAHAPLQLTAVLAPDSAPPRPPRCCGSRPLALAHHRGGAPHKGLIELGLIAHHPLDDARRGEHSVQGLAHAIPAGSSSTERAGSRKVRQAGEEGLSIGGGGAWHIGEEGSRRGGDALVAPASPPPSSACGRNPGRPAGCTHLAYCDASPRG